MAFRSRVARERIEDHIFSLPEPTDSRVACTTRAARPATLTHCVRFLYTDGSGVCTGKSDTDCRVVKVGNLSRIRGHQAHHLLEPLPLRRLLQLPRVPPQMKDA